MPSCRSCGLFGSLPDLWPTGFCVHNEGFVRATDAACVMYCRDFRGVDQSEGLDPEWKGEIDDADVKSVHGSPSLGPADPGRAEDMRKPQFPRSPGLLPGSRFRQSRLL